MKKKIVIAGGTGFIGSYLKDKLEQLDYDVLIISRDAPYVKWSDEDAIRAALENAEMLINLAGKSVNCRYTKENKEKILHSRTKTTTALGEAISKCKNPPPLWINASSATIYRASEDRPMTEENNEIGEGFSVNVVKQWEEAFFSFKLPDTRQVALRITIVLGKDGGAMKPYLNLAKFGLGGKQGEGNQMFSWIHIEDLFRIILFIQSHKELSGPINIGSPEPIDNKTFMKEVRKAMHVKIGLPAAAWMIKIGSMIIGTEPELILKSRYVLPQRLMDAGYTFEYPDIQSALKQIVER